jgi:hypothetical protein
MRVGKSFLINNAQNYIDEGIVSFYSITNKHLFDEMDAIIERRTSLGMVSFFTKGFDDITNACIIGLFYIQHTNLCAKQRLVPVKEVLNMDAKVYASPLPKKHIQSGSHW